MEITSFGLASKAANDLKSIRRDMGSGVTGTYPNVKARLDQVEKDIEMAYKLTDEVIINNALNISKALAKINAISKSYVYYLEQMIFDDLYDLSGIDLSLSSNYSHNYTAGTIQGGIIVTQEIYLKGNQKNLLFDVDKASKIEVSFDDGPYIEMKNNELNYLKGTQMTASKMRVKFTLSSSLYLNYYSVLWG